ncbi:MAG TPA: TerD family protein [Cyclobacteriaceae bacterium]|jgi:tellurium resistance protein TerZ|nr:TerD family protein [Cyclobacteriaceae bacterium]
MNLIKKSGINLKKGSSISLEKKGRAISRVKVGINWGVIKHQLWGLTYHTTAVDLDSSVVMFSNKNVVDNVYYNKLVSNDRSVRHSGDDRVGDRDGDDRTDNETIHVNLRTLDPSIDQVVFYLNSYEQQDFETIPYATISIVDTTAEHAQEELASFQVAMDKTFKGYVSMVLGKLVQTNSGWNFHTVGEPISARNIKECIRDISREYI